MKGLGLRANAGLVRCDQVCVCLRPSPPDPGLDRLGLGDQEFKESSRHFKLKKSNTFKNILFKSFSFTLIISIIGIPSVMQTIKGISFSIASSIAKTYS